MGRLISQTINHFFPDLKKQLQDIGDPRARFGLYGIEDLVFAAIAMFLMKKESRNEMNNDSRDQKMKQNFELLFGYRLPHMDTVDNIMRKLDEGQLEDLRIRMVNRLLSMKVLKKKRLLDKYLLIAIDASGVTKVKNGDEGTIKKESKNGKITYSRQILEAVFVIPGGPSIPICSEWLSSDKNNENKEDCEINAFKRLAIKLKGIFPKLPICLLVDGLYANEPFFDICKGNNWHFCSVLKDKKLSTVWDSVDKTLLEFEQNNEIDNMIIDDDFTVEWVNGIKYREHTLGWIEYTEKTKKFVFVTDLEIDRQFAPDLITVGRERWSIEDTFNTQKNRGYGLKKKFSRISFKALKNYHIIRQIAHMINQLVEYSQHLAKLIEQSKETFLHLWKLFVAGLVFVEDSSVFKIEDHRTKYRFDFG